MLFVLIVAAFVIALYMWANGGIMPNADEINASTIARVLVAEQERPADGEWEAIASVILNRMRKFDCDALTVRNGTHGYPWNDSKEFAVRFNESDGKPSFAAALTTARAMLRNGPSVLSMGFVHTRGEKPLPKWLTPVDAAIPTGGNKTAMFGGR